MKWCRIVSAGLIATLVSIAIVVILRSKGNTRWNASAVETTCRVAAVRQVEISCGSDSGGGGSEAGDRKRSGPYYREGGHASIGDTAPFGGQGILDSEVVEGVGSKKRSTGCSELYVTFTYLSKYSQEVMLASGADTAIAQEITDHYTIGTELSCWYQPDDLNDMELDCRSTVGWMVFGIILTIFACCILTGWARVECMNRGDTQKETNEVTMGLTTVETEVQ